jgi:Domain of unknown function (DUF4351)
MKPPPPRKLRLLTRCLGIVSPEIEGQIRQLSLGQIEKMAKTLLDFRSLPT